MQIYAMAIEKGGTGKSTLAVNLAAAFGQLRFRVLVIDLDAQGHSSYWLGVTPSTLHRDDSILGVINDRPSAECIRSTAEGVDLIPAHPSLSSLPIQLSSMPNGGLFVLQDVLGRPAVTNAYDIIIFDLAPARGLVLAAALAAATRCIAPVQPEELVIQALRSLNDSVAQAQRVNPRLRGISVVRNKYIQRSAGDVAYDQMLRNLYGPQLLKTTIPVRAALRDSAGLQQSVFRYNGGDTNEVRNLFLDMVEELVALDGIH
ncbi:MAG: ParA family protein [Chloroflexales bacterium]